MRVEGGRNRLDILGAALPLEPPAPPATGDERLLVFHLAEVDEVALRSGVEALGPAQAWVRLERLPRADEVETLRRARAGLSVRLGTDVENAALELARVLERGVPCHVVLSVSGPALDRVAALHRRLARIPVRIETEHDGVPPGVEDLLAFETERLAGLLDGSAALDLEPARMAARFACSAWGHPRSLGPCDGFYCEAGRLRSAFGPGGLRLPCARFLGAPEGLAGRVHEKDAFWARCQTCSAARICAYGCPAVDLQGGAWREVECEVTRGLESVLRSQVDRVAEVVRTRAREWGIALEDARAALERLERDGIFRFEFATVGGWVYSGEGRSYYLASSTGRLFEIEPWVERALAEAGAFGPEEAMKDARASAALRQLGIVD